MSVLAGSGPSLRPWRREQPVDVAEHDPGLHAHPRAAVLDPRAADQWRRTSTRTESVCAWPLSEVPPARKSAACRVRRAQREQRDDVVDVVGHRDRLRDQPVGAGVGGVADEVERAGQHALGAERLDQLAAQRLGRARRDPVGRAVGGGGRGRDRGRPARAAPRCTTPATSRRRRAPGPAAGRPRRRSPRAAPRSAPRARRPRAPASP